MRAPRPPLPAALCCHASYPCLGATSCSAMVIPLGLLACFTLMLEFFPACLHLCCCCTFHAAMLPAKTTTAFIAFSNLTSCSECTDLH